MPFIHKFGISADAKDHVHIFADDITKKICAQTEGLPYKNVHFHGLQSPRKVHLHASFHSERYEDCRRSRYKYTS